MDRLKRARRIPTPLLTAGEGANTPVVELVNIRINQQAVGSSIDSDVDLVDHMIFNHGGRPRFVARAAFPVT